MQVLNAYGKVYPTPPPSRRPIRVKQARLAAEKAAKEGDQPGGDGKGHEADGGPSDQQGRHKLGQLCLMPAGHHVCCCAMQCMLQDAVECAAG